MAKASKKTPGGRKGAGKSQTPFNRKLVLNQWLLSLFNVERLEDLAAYVKNEAQEGLDENNIHHFHHALTAQLFNLSQLPVDVLLEYDQNIVRHTLQLNNRRITRGEAPIVWKYFQYLALLFTEIYLDRYFQDPSALQASIKDRVALYNENSEEADHIPPFETARDAWRQLNKLAFWMATGSGKTLVMHANILQYQFYLEKHGKQRELNRIILLTPNEGLSQQHLGEFKASGIEAEIFSKDGRGIFTGKAVEILEVTKLKEEMGDKTIAVDAFEGNNLVLVDEGHRGASGGGDGVWMKNRNKLCENGFSFEYSATFGQAVKGSQALTDLYAKNILFDYSYRYFYHDGFGKEYQILNLDEATQTSHLELYLVASLLSFYQQQRLYREQEPAFRPFQIEKPLWIFVGGKVTAALATRDASDIVEIVQFFARYTSDRSGNIQRIDRILNQGLQTARGENLFSGRFAYLNTSGLDAAAIYEDTLATLFNAPAGGQLYVENLKGATGEIALRVGSENSPFGVINVGDDAKLVKLLEDRGIAAVDRSFTGSLFLEINKPHSTVNLLIGSKKFTEGWSSWRVSTMGLMNVGKTEGAQIIQLFGRGVRLKGYQQSLKRSGFVEVPPEVTRPKHLGVLETLGIFGIQADYMTQFREFLEEEGLPTNEDREEIRLPVLRSLRNHQLKTIRLKKTINGVQTDFGDAFRRLGPIPTLQKPDDSTTLEVKQLQEQAIEVNWYPKIQSMRSKGLRENASSEANEARLTDKHIAFLDLDALYFELERFKAERGWYNLNVSRADIAVLLKDRTWYRLLIPEDELAFNGFEQVRRWQEIALTLLKKYTERYYKFQKKHWELPHLEYRNLTEYDPNFPGVKEPEDESYYRVLVDRSDEEVITRLSELRRLIDAGTLKSWTFDSLRALNVDAHLYQPLLTLSGTRLEIHPEPLNEGEWRFVQDVQAFCEEHLRFFDDKEFYLLRNQSKGKGMGFFEAGNFHPDFILWLLTKKKQLILFADPKGIRQIGPSDPKIQFFETVKAIERRLGDTSVQLESFIISNTSYASMRFMWNVDKAEMARRHVLFQEDRETYIEQMFTLSGFEPA